MSWRDKIEKKQTTASGWRAKAESVRQQLETANEGAGVSNTLMNEPADVSSWQRFVAKSFAANPNRAAAYIKSKNPDLEVDVFNGEVVVRKKGEQNFKAIDPDTLELADLAELAPDVVAGGLQSLATTAAAIPAGVATGGWGALPAGMAASGTSGAALETARMGIGSALGIPDNIKGENITTAGLFGLAAPALLGVDNLPQSLQQSGRGLIKRGIDRAGSKAIEFATGIPDDVQQAYRTFKPQVQEMAASKNPYQTIYDVTDKIQDTLSKRETELGKNVGSAIDTAKGSVDISGAKKVFADRLNFLRSKPYITNAEQAEINSLQSYYNKYFGLAEPYTSFNMTENVVPQTRAATVFKQGSGVGPMLDEPSINMTKSTIEELPDKIKAQRAFDLQKKLDSAAAWETNMTPETRSAKGSARGAYFDINKALEEATSGLSQQAKDEFASYKAIQQDLKNKFNTPQQTFNTFIGLDKNSKRIALDRLKQLAGEGVLDVSPEVNKIRALNAFYDLPSDPYLQANQVVKNTPMQVAAGTTGVGLGYMSGLGAGGAIVGGVLGRQAGKLAGTKAAARSYINLGQALDALSKSRVTNSPLLNPANPALNPWLYQSEENP